MSLEKELYDSYPDNEAYMRYYIDYQKKYFGAIRRSDAVLLEMTARRVGAHATPDQFRLLDIGCSTGGLLFHLKGAFPKARLEGGDLSHSQIADCRNNPDLAGIHFDVMDLMKLHEAGPRYDVIIANAIFYGLTEELFDQGLKSAAGALKPGGALILFDFFHPYAQEVSIVEKSALFPNGHPLHFRSIGRTDKALAAAGLGAGDYRPFEIDVDLPHPGFDSVKTWTEPRTDGRRILWRGVIAQPWCHMMAVRG